MLQAGFGIVWGAGRRDQLVEELGVEKGGSFGVWEGKFREKRMRGKWTGAGPQNSMLPCGAAVRPGP